MHADFNHFSLLEHEYLIFWCFINYSFTYLLHPCGDSLNDLSARLLNPLNCICRRLAVAVSTAADQTDCCRVQRQTGTEPHRSIASRFSNCSGFCCSN